MIENSLTDISDKELLECYELWIRFAGNREKYPEESIIYKISRDTREIDFSYKLMNEIIKRWCKTVNLDIDTNN